MSKQYEFERMSEFENMYEMLLFEQTGFVDANAVSWKKVCIPIIERVINDCYNKKIRQKKAVGV